MFADKPGFIAGQMLLALIPDPLRWAIGGADADSGKAGFELALRPDPRGRYWLPIHTKSVCRSLISRCDLDHSPKKTPTAAHQGGEAAVKRRTRRRRSRIRSSSCRGRDATDIPGHYAIILLP